MVLPRFRSFHDRVIPLRDFSHSLALLSDHLDNPPSGSVVDFVIGSLSDWWHGGENGREKVQCVAVGIDLQR